MIENVFKIRDKDGIKVVLKRTVWEDKMLSPSPQGHPEVKPSLHEIKNALADPDLIFKSYQKENVKLF